MSKTIGYGKTYISFPGRLYLRKYCFVLIALGLDRYKVDRVIKISVSKTSLIGADDAAREAVGGPLSNGLHLWRASVKLLKGIVRFSVG